MKWWRRNGQDAKHTREKAEREKQRTQRMTPLIEQWAEHLADLPPEEFADRVRQAFRRPA